MKQDFSKCGNMCSSCPWGVWVRRTQSDEDWEAYVEDVKKYVGYSPTKNPCHGCQTPTEKLAKDVGVHNYLRGCSARKCAFHSGVRNCAYCSRYPCDKIKSLNLSNSRKDVEERIGEPITDDKYLEFVRIFEGMKNLDEIRLGLSSDQVQEVKTVDKKPPRITPFPDVKKKYSMYKSLHDTISSIIKSEMGLVDIDTLAGQDMLKNRRAVLLRLMWIAARYGSLDGKTLSVDSITINTHKKGTSGFPTSEEGWRRWLKLVSSIGIQADMKLASIDKSELISPIGWLRERIPSTEEPVWHLKLSLDEKIGGATVLKTLQTYAMELDVEFGKKAYSRFTKADMRLFQDKE